MVTTNKKKAKEIVSRMEPWWRDLEKRGKKPSRDGRTRNEECFDSGVMAAAEFVRRITGDESLSLLIHEVTSFMRKEASK